MRKNKQLKILRGDSQPPDPQPPKAGGRNWCRVAHARFVKMPLVIL